MVKRITGDTDGKDRNKAAAAVVADDAAFVGYINVTLTDTEKEGLESWVVNGGVWATLEYSVEDGVNISVKREVKSGGYLASATQRRPNSPNAGLCVTARAKEPSMAFSRLLYTLDILNRSESWTDTAAVANPDRW